MSEEALAHYSFLPWLRQGIASNIKTVDNLGVGNSSEGERASATITLTVQASDGNFDVTNTVQIFGPGDAIGIDPRAVVRTDPKNLISDFEPNYLPSIEFYDEDFPWRYTPATATPQHRLRPWICLVVLAVDEFERIGTAKGLLSAIRVANAKTLFPKPSDIWAWAHVHVNRDLKPKDGLEQALTNLTNTLRENSDLAVSRLLCPRRLKPRTTYHAFVIPTFETGRLAGLGMDISNTVKILDSAWGGSQTEFPVYYEWSFNCGERGDFEYLVRLLQSRAMDDRVGIRPMDVQRPDQGGAIPGITDPPALGLEGALKAPQTQSTEWRDKTPFQTALVNLINLSADLQEPGASQTPVVTPPLYGRWHAVVRRLRVASNPPWIETLNLDPRDRTVAGFGTLVVQDQQEDLMREAWRQLGNIEAANRRLKFAQLARATTQVLYSKHLTTLKPGILLSLTATVHARVMGGTVTVRQKVIESALPAATVNRGFRRIIRSRGPLMGRVEPGKTFDAERLIERVNRGDIAAAPPKTAPSEQIDVSKIADQVAWLPPFWSWLRLWLLLLIWLLSLLAQWIPLLRSLVQDLQVMLARGDAADTLRESNLSPERVTAIPPRPGFTLTEPGEPIPAVGTSGSDSLEAANFRSALLDLHERLQFQPPAIPVPQPLNLVATRENLLTALNPQQTISARVLSMVKIPLENIAPRLDPIEPIMAAPDFPQPMYEPLKQISPELLIPNVQLIPPNTISLLQTNQQFIESYMVGLNHEMARELLWRECPTDQRGSYFRQFWDVKDYLKEDTTLTDAQWAEKLRDIPPIHTWSRTSNLGQHNNRQVGEIKEFLVLVIRGDLLRRYPTAVIFAVKAIWLDTPIADPDTGALRDRVPDPQEDNPLERQKVTRFPLFKAEIQPDITFFGFPLTASEVKGLSRKQDNQPGWFFAIQERPGEARFGLDVADAPATSVPADWDKLSWGNLAANGAEFNTLTLIDPSKPLQPGNFTRVATNPDNVTWGANAADMAHILYQVPVKLYVHGSEMLL